MPCADKAVRTHFETRSVRTHVEIRSVRTHIWSRSVQASVWKYIFISIEPGLIVIGDHPEHRCQTQTQISLKDLHKP
jgi:hypothetical protein